MAHLTKRWIASYAAFVFFVVALAFSLLPAFERPSTEELPTLMLGSLGAALLVTGLTVGLLVLQVELDARRACARLATDLEPLLAAPAFFQARARYRRRPPGLIVVTATELRFAAAREKDAEHDLRWPLAEVEAVEPVSDRFGAVSRVLDVQGALAFRRGDEVRTFSIVGCHAFHQAFGELWGSAQAQARR